jgi:hypothetical protein
VNDIKSSLVSEKAEEEIKNDFKLDAIVRIRIPKKQPEPEFSDGGGTLIEPEEPVDQEKLSEIEFEDKAFSCASYTKDLQVWQFNQLAQRTFRRSLATELKTYIDVLETLELDDFNIKLEREAERFEEAFVHLFSDDNKTKNNAPKVPVFNFSPTV